ncbi:MAG: nicotinate phosphoribosyltransferase, partial [Candidatus Lokiarchaeota archaeon]
KVREILDENGCDQVAIVLSSNLDEYLVKEILDNKAPVKAFGIGTELVTSSDAPTLGAVYKLMEHNEEPKIKTSEDKKTYPSSKQVYRKYNNENKIIKDIIALHNEEKPEECKALLVPIMKKGELIYEIPSLKECREYCLQTVKTLPDNFKQLKKVKKSFNVKISEKLENLTTILRNKYK